MDNQNPLGITEHGTCVSICPQTQAERYRDAHRELFQHFLRTLKGGTRLKLVLLWIGFIAGCAVSGHGDDLKLPAGKKGELGGKIALDLAVLCDSQEILSWSPGCPKGIKITGSRSRLGRKRPQKLSSPSAFCSAVFQLLCLH